MKSNLSRQLHAAHEFILAQQMRRDPDVLVPDDQVAVRVRVVLHAPPLALQLRQLCALQWGQVKGTPANLYIS